MDRRGCPTQALAHGKVHHPKHGGAAAVRRTGSVVRTVLSCRTKEQWSLFALAVLSLTCLWCVGEASGVRRRGIEDVAAWFQCIKNGDKVVQRERGPYSAKWVWWLRDYGSMGGRRSPIMCPSGAPWLESFLEYRFRGTEFASHRWHCWKRRGTGVQKYLALPAEIRQWWGRWRSRRGAEDYAQPPAEYKVWTSIKLPWPEGPSKFVKRTTRGHDFWPTALSELFREGQQPVGQEPDVGYKRACIVLSDDDTPQRPRVQVRRTDRVRRDGGGSLVALAALGPRVCRVDAAASTA